MSEESPQWGPPLQLWDRRPDESNKAWHAFCLYRDMGYGRDLKSVAKEIGYAGRSTNQLYKWAREYDWAGRLAAFDAHVCAAAVAESKHRLTQQVPVILDKMAEACIRGLDARIQDGRVQVSEVLGAFREINQWITKSNEDGLIVEVEVPEDATPEQIMDALLAQKAETMGVSLVPQERTLEAMEDDE